MASIDAVARTPEEWRAHLGAQGHPRYRADQVFAWIHRQGVVDPEAMTNVQGMIRVATKYSQIASAHFGSRGIPVEIIQLSGSVELAPALGLADMIVDLVETGRTLRENGLTVIEEIAESTGRLVVNRASYQLKAGEVAQLVDALKATI